VDEIAVPRDSPWVGKTIGDTEIHRKYDLLALAVRKPNGENIYNPQGDMTLLAGDVLIVMGDVNKVRAARETAV
jgi:voltage-gated potassium channel